MANTPSAKKAARKIARRASTHSQSFALTEEYHRLSVVTQGKLLDADGTVLFNYFTEMGESQPAEVDWELDAASPADGDLRQKSANLMRVMGAALGGLPFNGILALAGNDFYDGLMKHKNYLDTYKGYEGVRELRNGFLPANNPQGGAWGVVEAFNITWANYRGGLGVDIGARSKIYSLMREISRDAAVIVISSDCDEVHGVADRTVALYKGAPIGAPDRATTRDQLLSAGIMGEMTA